MGLKAEISWDVSNATEPSEPSTWVRMDCESYSFYGDEDFFAQDQTRAPFFSGDEAIDFLGDALQQVDFGAQQLEDDEPAASRSRYIEVDIEQLVPKG